MAQSRLRRRLVGTLATLLGIAACVSDQGPGSVPAQSQLPSGGARTVVIGQLDLVLRVPAELSDLTYRIGEFEEEQPALFFSTRTLTSVGGDACAAGATGAVSPYPIGQVIVASESPGRVRREAEENPEEDLGEFVKAVADRYLYYIAPPDEGCAAGDSVADAMQDALTDLLRPALRTTRAAP